jgi:hypothetical protein
LEVEAFDEDVDGGLFGSVARTTSWLVRMSANNFGALIGKSILD